MSPGGFAASAAPFAAFVQMVSQAVGRPVVDKTGIKGFYDFKLQFTREGIAGGAGPFGPLPPGGPGGIIGGPDPAGAASDPMPSIFTALQEQLGLKLDSTKGQVDVFVIDSVEKPTEN